MCHVRKDVLGEENRCVLCGITYCSNTTCALYKGDMISADAKCTKCNKNTCYFCFVKHKEQTECDQQNKTISDKVKNVLDETGLLGVSGVADIAASMATITESIGCIDTETISASFNTRMQLNTAYYDVVTFRPKNRDNNITPKK